jgi:hypothetical protein
VTRSAGQAREDSAQDQVSISAVAHGDVEVSFEQEEIPAQLKRSERLRRGE